MSGGGLPGSAIWMIGGHMLYAVTTCRLYGVCANDHNLGWRYYEYTCTTMYTMEDKFAQPLTPIGGWKWEPGGTPFWYHFEFMRTHFGCGISSYFDASKCNRPW